MTSDPRSVDTCSEQCRYGSIGFMDSTELRQVPYLSRIRRLTTFVLLVSISLYVALAAVRQPEASATVLLIPAGTAALALAWRWDDHLPWPWVALGLVVTFSVACWAWFAGWEGSAALPLGIALGVVLSNKARALTAVLLATAIGAVLAALSVAFLTTDGRLGPWAASLLILAAPCLVLVANRLGWSYLLELERARQASAEVARLSERERISRDLHDVQGHAMVLLKLKVSLIERLAVSDPLAAQREAAAAREYLAQTIRETHELIDAARHFSLPGELSNARALLEAAGVSFTETGTRNYDLDDEPVVARIIRECVTNVLKHSQATTVTLHHESNALTLVNDGVTGRPGQPRGLADLERGVRSHGWSLTWSASGNRFVVLSRVEIPERATLPLPDTEGTRG